MKDFSGLSPDQLAGQMGAQAQIDPLLEAFRQYAKARDEFHDSCRGLVEAQQRRTQAELQLQELSQQLSATVQQNLIDPTTQPAPPSTPNGAWAQPNQQYSGGFR